MRKIYIRTDNPQKRNVEMIANSILDGNVVLIPGDTSYMFAIKIGDKNALEKLHFIKKDKKRKFYSILLRNLSDLSLYTDISNQNFSFIKRYLPGSFTFIVKASRKIPKIMLEKRKEIGIRLSDSPFMTMLSNLVGEPFLVSTAARDNEEIFSDPEMDFPEWLNAVDIFADGGYVPFEQTTVVQIGYDEFEIVREGKGIIENF